MHLPNGLLLLSSSSGSRRRTSNAAPSPRVEKRPFSAGGGDNERGDNDRFERRHGAKRARLSGEMDTTSIEAGPSLRPFYQPVSRQGSRALTSEAYELTARYTDTDDTMTYHSPLRTGTPARHHEELIRPITDYMSVDEGPLGMEHSHGVPQMAPAMAAASVDEINSTSPIRTSGNANPICDDGGQHVSRLISLEGSCAALSIYVKIAATTMYTSLPQFSLRLRRLINLEGSCAALSIYVKIAVTIERAFPDFLFAFTAFDPVYPATSRYSRDI
ncbi:hypothetical protein EVJ58_g7304 [Rhodofomes roseus]|uniref:Uncharacterized protein n=1 Tax=Rhodofomes roseus TaxID=34475 RepID=A0A4Y9Y4Y1_9APHY|nr:hypothetical protein EVJ58_g7304 [Rhodofomes roseus]